MAVIRLPIAITSSINLSLGMIFANQTRRLKLLSSHPLTSQPEICSLECEAGASFCYEPTFHNRCEEIGVWNAIDEIEEREAATAVADSWDVHSCYCDFFAVDESFVDSASVVRGEIRGVGEESGHTRGFPHHLRVRCLLVFGMIGPYLLTKKYFVNTIDDTPPDFGGLCSPVVKNIPAPVWMTPGSAAAH